MSATAERINPWRMFTGSWVPTWLLQRREISPAAKLVYARLARYAGKRGIAFPRQATMAAELGMHERALRRALLELRNFGLIFGRQGGDGKPVRWVFLNHRWITGAGISGRTSTSGLNASGRTSTSGLKPSALKDRARGLEESHKPKRVTPAAGSAPAGRPPLRNSRSNPTVSRSPRVQKIVGGLAEVLSMKR